MQTRQTIKTTYTTSKLIALLALLLFSVNNLTANNLTTDNLATENTVKINNKNTKTESYSFTENVWPAIKNLTKSASIWSIESTKSLLQMASDWLQDYPNKNEDSKNFFDTGAEIIKNFQNKKSLNKHIPLSLLVDYLAWKQFLAYFDASTIDSIKNQDLDATLKKFITNNYKFRSTEIIRWYKKEHGKLNLPTEQRYITAFINKAEKAVTEKFYLILDEVINLEIQS
ncbi:MAG: hypothetical protein ABH827_04505 [bacterium]